MDFSRGDGGSNHEYFYCIEPATIAKQTASDLDRHETCGTNNQVSISYQNNSQSRAKQKFIS